MARDPRTGSGRSWGFVGSWLGPSSGQLVHVAQLGLELLEPRGDHDVGDGSAEAQALLLLGLPDVAVERHDLGRGLGVAAVAGRLREGGAVDVEAVHAF